MAARSGEDLRNDGVSTVATKAYQLKHGAWAFMMTAAGKVGDCILADRDRSFHKIIDMLIFPSIVFQASWY